MSKEKQIEEPAEILRKVCDATPNGKCMSKLCCACRAETVIEAGYRKQSEAEWIKRNYSCYCSVCGGEHGFAFTTGSAHNYCPKCGAKMKGGEQ